MQDLYQSQRAMRAMRKAALQRGVIAVLDIGTSKIACLVLRVSGADPVTDRDGIGSMAGQARFRVIGAATTKSRGVRYGEVDTMAETEKAIRTVVQSAQKMANMRVDHVIACLSGGAPRSYGVDGSVDVAGNVVHDSDIANALATCDVPDFGPGREVLHAQPVNFSLDHRSGLQDPRGQLGEQLSCDLHMLTVDEGPLRNLVRCIERCDLELAGIASSAYLSGLSALVEAEQELGAACIDMGGGSTGISMFMRKHMLYADSVRIGGDHITKDISMGLQIPLAEAEKIKTKFGGLIATGADDRDIIELGGDTGDWEHDRRTVSRADLIGIIRPRVEEILEEVRARLEAGFFESLPSQQIVLTGGGSQILGLDQLAARILGQQVRLGRPLRVRGLPQATTGPSFAAAVGLTLFAVHPQDEWWAFDVPADRTPARSLRRAVRWFKDNW